MGIYVMRGKKRLGPYSPATIRSYLDSAKLLPTDVAWFEGLEQWRPLSELLPRFPGPTQSMPFTGGFEHLHIITKAIHELYRRFGPQHVKSYRNTFALGTSADDLRREPLIGTQHLAKRIAAHYRLPVTTVMVTFSSSLKPPGRVELSQSNEFLVELQSKYRFAPKAIAAILAHEVAHIFLHRCGVRFPDEFERGSYRHHGCICRFRPHDSERRFRDEELFTQQRRSDTHAPFRLSYPTRIRLYSRQARCSLQRRLGVQARFRHFHQRFSVRTLSLSGRVPISAVCRKTVAPAFTSSEVPATTNHVYLPLLLAGLTDT